MRIHAGMFVSKATFHGSKQMRCSAPGQCKKKRLRPIQGTWTSSTWSGKQTASAVLKSLLHPISSLHRLDNYCPVLKSPLLDWANWHIGLKTTTSSSPHLQMGPSLTLKWLNNANKKWQPTQEHLVLVSQLQESSLSFWCGRQEIWALNETQ